MKIIYFGTSAFGIPALNVLKKSSHQILTVATMPDKPQGRHLKIQPSPVKEWALENRLPLFEFSDINSAESLQRLKGLGADLFVVISFGVIFSKEFIAIPRRMALNVHPSLLPRYRGAAPMPWALMNGDKETGVSIVRVEERLDAGDILLQKKMKILPEDDIISLEARLSGVGAEALVEGIDLIERGSAVLTPQGKDNLFYARKLSKEDGHVKWAAPASEIRNHIRAMLVWPGSYCFYKGHRIIVLETSVSGSEIVSKSRPGTVIAASRSGGILVAAGDGPLEIKTLQIEGRKPLSAKEFLNGFPLEPGQILE